jgi:hypothetical protein
MHHPSDGLDSVITDPFRACCYFGTSGKRLDDNIDRLGWVGGLLGLAVHFSIMSAMVAAFAPRWHG